MKQKIKPVLEESREQILESIKCLEMAKIKFEKHKELIEWIDKRIIYKQNKLK